MGAQVMPCPHPLAARRSQFSQICRWVKLFATLLFATVICGYAVAENLPMPRPRPAEAITSHSPQAADPENAATPSDCQIRLKRVAVASALPPIAGAGECAADDVVELETILLPNKAHVAVTPAATVRCSLAEAIAQWVREDVAPRVRVFDSSLKSLDNYASFDCRGRNRVAGATLSEHGKANALDIRSLKLMNGRVVKLTDPELSRDFRESLRRSACVRFATVLGPGSDGYHEDHIHVDLAERRNAQHLCRWDVHEPDTDNVAAETPVPLPRPRPAHRS